MKLGIYVYEIGIKQTSLDAIDRWLNDRYHVIGYYSEGINLVWIVETKRKPKDIEQEMSIIKKKIGNRIIGVHIVK